MVSPVSPMDHAPLLIWFDIRSAFFGFFALEGVISPISSRIYASFRYHLFLAMISGFFEYEGMASPIASRIRTLFLRCSSS